MSWPNLGQWEWAIGEAVVLPLLFYELYRLRRSQRLDREKAARMNLSRDVAGQRKQSPSDPPTDSG